MIGKLHGKIDLVREDYLILDVNGVGYRVFCSSKILGTCKIGEELTLIINTIVREDAILLFGFASENEKNWFDVLCEIKGIGNKMALKIMGAMTPNDIILAIDSEDSKSFCRVPGIGQKIASRLVVELQHVRKRLEGGNEPISATSISTNTNEDNKMRDALSALENLGYQRSIVHGIIVSVLKERPDIVLESLITEALKRLNRF